MDDRVIIVSSDSHAGVPKELWSDYLDARFHELIPQLRADNEIYPTAIYVLTSRRATAPLPEVQEAHRAEYHGLHDPVLRLADMDREGIAAELIFHGDFRLGDMFHNSTNRVYPTDAWDAGARGWNRWAADTFGFAMDRFLVVGAIGSCVDMDATLADLEWVADHEFTGTYGPGYMRRADTPPSYDPYWEPFWSACEAHDLPVVVHAGFGTEQGVVFPHLERIYNDVAAKAGSTELDVMLQHSDAVPQESLVFFHDFLSHGIPARRPFWQMTLGGVFDRHPRLKLLLTEIRLDWIPATLQHLDAVYDEHRADLPARRRPSEYWHERCMAGASFIHKAEVDMRHEIGVDTILFGRDFPHPEGTWPHTREWLRDAFGALPDDEVLKMLGENGVRFFGLDRERLADIAKRIGPSLRDITDAGAVPAELVASFDDRGGYLRAPEGGERLAMVDAMLEEDLAGVGVTA